MQTRPQRSLTGFPLVQSFGTKAWLQPHSVNHTWPAANQCDRSMCLPPLPIGFVSHSGPSTSPASLPGFGKKRLSSAPPAYSQSPPSSCCGAPTRRPCARAACPGSAGAASAQGPPAVQEARARASKHRATHEDRGRARCGQVAGIETMCMAQADARKRGGKGVCHRPLSGAAPPRPSCSCQLQPCPCP